MTVFHRIYLEFADQMDLWKLFKWTLWHVQRTFCDNRVLALKFSWLFECGFALWSKGVPLNCRLIWQIELKYKLKWPFYWVYGFQNTIRCEKSQIFSTHYVCVCVQFVWLRQRMKKNCLEAFMKKRHVMNECTQAVATFKCKSRVEIYEFIWSLWPGLWQFFHSHFNTLYCLPALNEKYCSIHYVGSIK